jgi:transposase
MLIVSWSNKEEEKLIFLYNQGMSYSGIAEALHRGKHSIKGRIYELQKKGILTEKIRDIQHRKIIDLKTRGLDNKYIAWVMHCSLATVRNVLNKEALNGREIN